MGLLRDALNNQDPDTKRFYKLVEEGNTQELFNMWKAVKDINPAWAHTLKTYHEAALLNELQRRQDL